MKNCGKCYFEKVNDSNTWTGSQECWEKCPASGGIAFATCPFETCDECGEIGEHACYDKTHWSYAARKARERRKREENE